MSSEGEQKKPLDVSAIIEAKRQRMAQGSAAAEDAKAKASRAAAEFARRAAEKREAQGPLAGTRPEEPHERLARLGEARKQQAALLAEITLVPVDESEKATVPGPSGSGKRRRSSRRQRRSGRVSARVSARASRTSGSRPGSSGAGLILGIGAAILVGLLLLLLLR